MALVTAALDQQLEESPGMETCLEHEQLPLLGRLSGQLGKEGGSFGTFLFIKDSAPLVLAGGGVEDRPIVDRRPAVPGQYLGELLVGGFLALAGQKVKELILAV